MAAAAPIQNPLNADGVPGSSADNPPAAAWFARIQRLGLEAEFEAYVLSCLTQALEEGYIEAVTDGVIDTYVKECARQLLVDLCTEE